MAATVARYRIETTSAAAVPPYIPKRGKVIGTLKIYRTMEPSPIGKLRIIA
jgi:hypothetical protein